MLVGAGLGAGCASAFGLEPPQLHDATVEALADGPSCISVMATLVEDTMLLDQGNTNPSIRFGASDTINIGQAGVSRILLRFQASQSIVDALGPAGGAVEASLSLMIRTSGGACGSTCPSNATSFEVLVANNYWNEGSPSAAYLGAEWFNRYQTTMTNGQPWQAPGADGSIDRSTVVLGTAAVAAGASGTTLVTMPLDSTRRADLNARLEGGQVSLILVPTSGGPLFLYAREGSASSATLAFSICN